MGSNVIALTAGGGKSDPGAIDLRVAAVAAALAERLTEVSRSIDHQIQAEDPELNGDVELVRLREASVAGSVATVLHILRFGLSPRDVEPPPITVEYVRRLAQRGLPVGTLRYSGVGPADFLNQAFAEMDRHPSAQDTDASRKLSFVVFEYIEETYGRIVQIYQAERDQWMATRHALRLVRILDLLNGREIPDREANSAFESAVGYRLTGRNVGLVIWRDKPSAIPAVTVFERFALKLSEVVEATDHLVVPWDAEAVWVWLSGRNIVAPTSEEVALAMTQCGGSVRVASGASVVGAEGFRLTHDQALQAREVALAKLGGAPTLTRYEDVGAMALLHTDTEQSAAWIRHVLGQLCMPTKAAALKRETLMVFLRQGNSFTSAAAILNVHPNTVKYRVSRAEHLLGRPIESGRLDIELALQLCSWFGPPALNASQL